MKESCSARVSVQRMFDMVRRKIYRNNVFLPCRRVFGDLAPALLVHTFVYTIVVDDHENDWEIIPKERYILYNHSRRTQLKLCFTLKILAFVEQ